MALNVRVHADATVRVAAIRKNGVPIPGLRLNEAVVLTAVDGTAVVARCMARWGEAELAGG